MDRRFKFLLAFLVAVLAVAPGVHAWVVNGDTYEYRYPISSSATASWPFNVNDTYAPDVWTKNATSLYLYCAVSGCATGKTAIGDGSANALAHEFENSSDVYLGYNPGQVWNESNLKDVWHFKNATGFDSKYATSTLTAVNTPTSVTGVFGNAADFNGKASGSSPSYMNNNSFNTDGDFTVITFVKKHTQTTNTYDRIIQIGVGDASAEATTLNFAGLPDYATNNKISVCGWALGCVESENLNTEQWYCVAYTRNDATNNNSLYVNGTYKGSVSFAFNGNAGDNIGIGARGGGSSSTSNALNGSIEEMRYYGRILSSQEIMDYCKNGFNTLSSTGSEETTPAPEVLTTTISPATLYIGTDVNCSIYYNTSVTANVTAQIYVNQTTLINSSTWTLLAPASTRYLTIAGSNLKKHYNVTCNATALKTGGGSLTANQTIEVSNSLPTAPSITFNLSSVIIGDNFNFTGSSTDADGDSLTYWYLQGFYNGTNITGWSSSDVDLLVNASMENDTLRIYAKAYDGEANGTINSSDMIVTRMNILFPVDGTKMIGDTFNFSKNLTVNYLQPCVERVGSSVYNLGYLDTGIHNDSRYIFYGLNNTYNLTCFSLQDSSRNYTKLLNFSNIFGVWNVSIYTENAWTTPLNISAANLSIIITCDGGETYVWNFTGVKIEGIEPMCDVQTITAKVNYETDSYTRERVPPDCTVCEVPMYLTDALVYTVLQIPVYMSDFNYYDGLIELYKSSGGNHYTIAQGYFDVEHKYVTYLTKDNTYFIRLTKDSEVRDIGYLYAATATAQYLSLSQIQLVPSITLITNNIRMAAAFDNESAPLTTLRIQYRDLLNMTESVRIRVFQGGNNTAFYDSTFSGISNFSATINNVNTSFRYSVTFEVNHSVLGNSPIPFTTGVGAAGQLADLALPATLHWIYFWAGFFVVLMTAFIIVPENRLPGYFALLLELGAFSIFEWFQFQGPTLAYFVVFPVAGIIYELKKQKGVS